MAVEDLNKYNYVLLNDAVLSRFESICEDCGFLGKCVATQDAAQQLLTDVFPVNKQLQLKYVLQEYSIYAMRHAKPNDRYYCKVKEKLDNNDKDLKDYLTTMNLVTVDSQIFCILALSIFRFLLKEKDIDIIVETKF